MLNIIKKPRDDAIIVALGGNLAGRFKSVEALLQAALGALPSVGLSVVQVSRWWRSTAWPDTAHPDYLNGVALVETPQSPQQMLQSLLDLEARFGRRRGSPNSPRTLDLDLIAYGRTVVASAELTLPHPRAHLRRFVMGPLSEVAPGWIHPGLGRSVEDLARSATIGLDATPLE